MEPPRVLWPDRCRGLLANNHKMAGIMIPPEILKHKSLFSLLYQIDLDLVEQTRARNCPFAGVHCIAPTTIESLGVGPLTCRRLLICDSVCAAPVVIVGVGLCRHRCVSGGAGCTGHPLCCWSRSFARGEIRMSPLIGSRGFAGYGVPPSSAGSTISGNFFRKASPIGACPGD